nr:hypothetical protein [uncultured Dyadobacter sp.]
MPRSVIVLLSLLFNASCHSEREKSPELVEANPLHLEAIKIASELETKLKRLATQPYPLTVKVQADSLQKLIELWERNVVEVPGFPHTHDHAHGAHEHQSVPPMTDQSMLDYQQKSWEAIKELQRGIVRLEIAH